MSGDEYIAAVVRRYAVDRGEGCAGMRAAREVAGLIEEWAGSGLAGWWVSGSYAKGTAVSLCADVDLFVSLEHEFQEREVGAREGRGRGALETAGKMQALQVGVHEVCTAPAQGFETAGEMPSLQAGAHDVCIAPAQRLETVGEMPSLQAGAHDVCIAPAQRLETAGKMRALQVGAGQAEAVKSGAVKSAVLNSGALQSGSLQLASMSEIYWGLLRFCADRGMRPRAQNVSVRVECGGVKVDVVPARRRGAGAKAPLKRDEIGSAEAEPLHEANESQYEAESRYEAGELPASLRDCDHTLYKRKKDSWVQTNVETHVRVVVEAGLGDEIRALKIWRERHRVEMASFYLELTVIEALQGRKRGLAENVTTVLRYLKDELGKARVVDPANSNNIISDDLEPEEKRLIAVAAEKSLMMSGWELVLW